MQKANQLPWEQKPPVFSTTHAYSYRIKEIPRTIKAHRKNPVIFNKGKFVLLTFFENRPNDVNGYRLGCSQHITLLINHLNRQRATASGWILDNDAGGLGFLN
jgi:hypothetical protein